VTIVSGIAPLVGGQVARDENVSRFVASSCKANERTANRLAPTIAAGCGLGARHPACRSAPPTTDARRGRGRPLWSYPFT
jgi:hypothetical protein